MPGTIVVGVDGSSPSVAALRWAVAEAELRDAQVVAVHSWAFVLAAPTAEPGMFPMPGIDLTGQLEAERAVAETELEAAIATAFPDGPPIAIEKRLDEGDPAEALVGESSAAELVVVGSSGRSGLASVVLGSVSRHVVQHAHCPVVVVKAKSD